MHELLLIAILFCTLSTNKSINYIDTTVILNATAAGFGVATGPVLIDETRCVGNETRLLNCRHNGVGTHNCAHSRDVGLRCVIRKDVVLLSFLDHSYFSPETFSHISLVELRRSINYNVY